MINWYIIRVKIKMIKIGITGSISSGKTTASKIISRKTTVIYSWWCSKKILYKEKFWKLLANKLNIILNKSLKNK